MKENLHVAVAGATGAVGQDILHCLEEREFPLGKLTLLASKRSIGKKVSFLGKEIEVEELTTASFPGVDIVLFSVGAQVVKEYAPAAVEAGAVVVDNSSAYRMDEEVPLVIPEINGEDIRKRSRGILANPNCTTITLLMALYPLHREFGVKRLFASSYQAVSGSGLRGVTELKNQVEALFQGKSIEKNFYPHQIAFNVIPQVEPILENGYTKEEMKIQAEGGKIMHHPKFKASVTCVRVPVYRAHSVAVSAEFERPVDVERARKCLEAAPGVRLVDDREHHVYPTPLDATGKEDCLVGRLRKDCVFENGLSFWSVGDQLLKGAALNAVQIAELVAEDLSVPVS